MTAILMNPVYSKIDVFWLIMGNVATVAKVNIIAPKENIFFCIFLSGISFDLRLSMSSNILYNCVDKYINK